jgi:hypothetical protein
MPCPWEAAQIPAHSTKEITRITNIAATNFIPATLAATGQGSSREMGERGRISELWMGDPSIGGFWTGFTG